MIQVIPIRHDIDSEKRKIRTHVLNPQFGATLMLTIQGKKENIISILEDHILETISSIEWTSSESDKDFTFLTENYNRFIRNLEPQDLADISVIVSLLKDNVLTISGIGNASAYLVEGDEITKIVDPDAGRFDFHMLTSGNVSRNASIYISNTDALEVLGAEFLSEFSVMSSQEFQNVAKNIFDNEISRSFHLVRIAHSFKNTVTPKRHRGRGQLDLLKERGRDLHQKIRNSSLIKKAKEYADSVDFQWNEKQKYGFMVVGILLVFVLVFVLVRSISGVIGGNGFNDEYATKVKQAQSLVQDSRTLTSNPDAFSVNMKQAEELLSELRQAQKYLTDVQTIQGDIDTLKKEVYGIETIDLTQKTNLVPFNTETFQPLQAFETNNKFLVIGKNGLITDYVRGTDAPKVLSYPQDDSANFGYITEGGTPFILSNANRLMTLRQDGVVNITAGSQNIWEIWPRFKTYNNNIYAVNAEQNQIYKYASGGASGFLSKINVLPNTTSSKILDIAVDGAYYIMTADSKISRFVPTKSDEGLKTLVLNKIPGSWNIDSSLSTDIIANNNLSYVYIRNGKTIWIFQPNSRDYRSINALTYVAQLQIQSEDDVTGISVPRDGILYITTKKGVFEAQFQVSAEGKFYLK